MTPHPQGLTVVGNLAVDRVDNQPVSAGGCPSFCSVPFASTQVSGRVITKRAVRDAPLFAGLLESIGVPVTVLDAPSTNGFGLRYAGDSRRMVVDELGEPWSRDDLAGHGPLTEWLHAAPLLRGEISAELVNELAAEGHLISYDGQGLVRQPGLGDLTFDGRFDRDILRGIQVLKLSDDEAPVAITGDFDERAARELGVPEILVTFGSLGADLYVNACREHIPAARRIESVQTTGAGDMFTVTYAALRSTGAPPLDAARHAAEVVAGALEHRRLGGPG